MGSLVGHLIFGIVLGITFAWLRQRTFDRALAATGSPR
jgi:hypothetical protein